MGRVRWCRRCAKAHPMVGFIAIHRKFQTRRAAEDSTRLYGEAAQHSMRLSVDGYMGSNPSLQAAREGLMGGLQASAAVMDTARVASNPTPALPHGVERRRFVHLFLSTPVWCRGVPYRPGGLQTSAAVMDTARVASNPSPALPQRGSFLWWRAEARFLPLGAVYRMLTAASTSSCVSVWPSCAFTTMLLW